MRLIKAGERLAVVDTPGGMWAFALLFVASGTLVLTIPFLADEWATFVLWQRAAVLAIGAAHLAAGLGLIRHHPATRTELDRASGTGVHRVRLVGSRRTAVTAFELAEILSVRLQESKDSDGDAMCQLRLTLRDGRPLFLQGRPSHGERAARAALREVRQFLGLGEGTAG